MAAATIRSGGRGRPTIGQDAPQEHGVPGHSSRRAIQEAGFVNIVHADDLNGFREFEHNASVDSVMTEAKRCQVELHKWGKAKQASFDPAMESVRIVSHAQPHGDSFKLLGVAFDCNLGIQATTILRTRRFHEVTRLVQVYKSKILSFVEYRIGVPRSQNHTGRNLCDSEALPSRVESHGRRHTRVLQPGPAGNTTRYCNAGPDSPNCSWMWPETLCEHVPTRATIGLSETLLAPPVAPWFPKSAETGPFDTGSRRCLQSASSKGGGAEERRGNATRIAMPPEIQSCEQGGRLTAHLFTSRLSV